MLWMTTLVAVAMAAGPAERALHAATPSGLPGVVQPQVQAHGPVDADGYGARGTTVTLHRTLEGLPVEPAGAVWLGPEGAVRHVRSLPDLPVRSGPRIGFDSAVREATARVPGGGGRGRLTWQAVGGALQAVWTLHFAHSADPRWVQPVVRVDAVTGRVLSVREGARHVDAVARVFPRNPALDPEPVEVGFELPGAALADDRLEMMQCADLGEVRTYTIRGTEWDYHLCTEVPALEDPDGLHLFDPVPEAPDPARDEDAFVAPNLFWNVSQGLDWFTARGWEPQPDFDPYLTVVANQRTTDLLTVETAGDPDLPLYPYDNAYSTGGWFDWEGVWVPPRLVFGQGRHVDYGYDADVTHHELGHYIVKSRTGPSWSEGTVYGSSVDANALNEGLADYFSSAIQGDAQLAEYAAGPERDAIRDLSGDATCADDRLGQSHADGQPFAQGLWSFRTTLAPADAEALDTVVIDSLSVMGPNADFATAYAVITDGVDVVLGNDAGDALRAAWQARGLPDCVPIVHVAPDPEEPFRSYAAVPYFTDDYYETVVPGMVQYVVDVPEAGSLVTLRAVQVEFLGIDPYGTNRPVPPLVVGGPGEAITWTESWVYDTFTYDGYTFQFAKLRWDHDQTELGTLVEVGTEPHPDLPDRYLLHHVELQIEAEAAGPLVFQFANATDGHDVTLYELGLTIDPPEPVSTTPPTTPTPTTSTTSGSSDTTTATVAQGEGDEAAKGKACGCTVAPTPGGSVLGLGWLGLALARARRRAVSGRRGPPRRRGAPSAPRGR